MELHEVPATPAVSVDAVQTAAASSAAPVGPVATDISAVSKADGEPHDNSQPQCAPS